MDAPCILCGYNGPNFYQPTTHQCASIWHAYGGRKLEWLQAVIMILKVENETLKGKLAAYEQRLQKMQYDEW